MILVFVGLMIVSVTMMILNIIFSVNIFIILLPTLLLLWLSGIIFPGNFSRAVALFPEISGSAGALFVGILFLLTGISSAIGTNIKATSGLPLSFAYLIIVLSGFILSLCLGRAKLSFS